MASFSSSCYCIITGASKGLGREMAIQFAREWKRTSIISDLVLIARSKSGLEETKKLVMMENKDTSVTLLEADLSNLETLSSMSDKVMDKFDPSKHRRVFLVHNAGTLGDITRPIHQQQNPGPLSNMATLHLTSMWLLTAKVISIARGVARIMVLNISSLLATLPMAGLASYSMTRAARNMFVKTLCLENKGESFRGFTYSPGPCDTGMNDAIKNEVCFEESKKMLDGMKLLKSEESIEKLMKIIKDDTFENGAVIDFYDYD